jgi:tRNA 2-thiouridine synthesizing protein A
VHRHIAPAWAPSRDAESVPFAPRPAGRRVRGERLEKAAAVAQVLDCKGLLCPMPIIKLSKAIKTIAVGEIIEMWTTDPSSVPDMQAFQKLTGHQVLSSDRLSGAFRFLIQRAK